MKYIFWTFLLVSSSYADDLPVFNKYMDNEALSENIPVGQSIYKLEGVDSFGNENDLLYGIEGTDYLVVDSNTGVVTVNKPLDHEESDTLKFTVTLQQKNSTDVVRLPISVIILDENDNAPKFLHTPYEGMVNEESKIGTTVFKWIHVEDLDKVGEPLEVRCESVFQNEDGCLKFKIQPLNVSESYYLGVLVVNGDIQYSETQFYKLNLIASDGVHETKINLDINVKDIQNMPPVFHGSLTTVISEDISVGTHILTVSAKDGDRGDPRSIVYDLIQNPMDYFSLDGLSGNLSTAKPIDRETLTNNNGIITLTVRAREIFNGSALDDKLSSSTAIITITVQDVNDEPPIFNKRDYFISIPENIAPGTPLPNLNMSVTDSDLGANSEFSLRLHDESKLFVVEPTKAIGSIDVGIKLANNVKLDYEDPNQRKFIVLVIASEPSEKYDLTSTATLTIQVTDVNDNPPEFDNNAYTLTVNETATPGTVIGVVKATDRDSNPSIIYTLSGPSADKFYVEKTTGVISVALCSNVGKPPCLDYETQSNYYLTYIATDDNGKGQSNSVTIMVLVTDSNDNPPMFIQHTYTSLIDEGVTTFEPPLIVQAIDADKSSSIIYSILSGDERHLFKIDQSSGEIFISSPNGLQRSKNNITLIISASDGVYNDEATVNIVVLDVNNNSPQFLLESYNVSIHENEPVGFSVITVEAIDEDLDMNANLTYHIQEGSFNHFAIDPITGLIYTSSKLDFDQHSNYAIKTLAIDKGTPALTGSTTVLINIINVNNKSPEFIPLIQRTEVSEDVPVGTVIYRLIAHDPDTSDENALNFSLNYSEITGFSSNGNQLNNNADIKNWFKIRASNGDVIIAKSIDRNIAAIVSLSVVVTDTSAPDVQQSTGTLMVTIIDINDIPPVFNPPWTKDNPYYTVSCPEEQPIGTVIGKFIATDDSGIDYYDIIPKNPFVDVNRTSGVIFIKEKLDFETIENIDLNLIVYDTGHPQLSTTATVFIKITNINDNTPVFNQTEYKAEIEENAPVGTFVTIVIATDADKGLFGLVRYSIIGNKYGFIIDPDTGIVKVNDSSFLDREVTSDFMLTIQAKDEAPPGLTKTAVVLLFIKLIDVNDNPPQFDPKSYSLSIIVSTPTTPLMQLKAIDKDLNSKLKYSIISGNKDLFTIDMDTGFLYSAMSLNGKKGVYLIEVDVFDGVFRDQANINITVLDVNQNQPIFVHPSTNNSTLSILEDVSVGTSILTVCAEDKDFGENGRVTYFFKVANSNAQQTDEFIINTETGQIKTQILLDYETKPSYQLVLVARDQGSPTWHETLKLLTVNLIDVNDNKPRFPVHNDHKPLYTFSVKENNRPQFKIGQIKATDLDQGENARIYYYLLSNKPVPFIVDRLDGTIYANETLDREEQSSYEIIVKASNDNDYHQKNDEEDDDYSLAKVLILVTDENDNAPVFQTSHYYAGVNTMAKVGDVVLQVTSIDLDYEENSTVLYYIENTQLYRPGLNNLTWSSLLKDPFSIDQSGRISTSAFLAEYNQGRFDLQIAAKEIAPPYRVASTTATVWVYETHQLVKLIVSRAPQTVNEGREQILSSLANVTNMIVVLDDVRYHVNQYGYIQPDWSDVYLHLVDPTRNDIMSSWEVLTIIDDKYDYLKDYYHNFAIENVVPALVVTQNESFEPTIAALVALLVVLTVGCIGVLIICCCFRHWMFSELDNNSIKNDILIKKAVIDDLSTTENPLWIEQKLKLYEEQELTMQVFCDLENKEMPISQDNIVGDNTYATIRRPSRRGSINTLLTMTPGEYATLGGSVLPLPPDGATSHSQQLFEASLGFQGSTFQVPDSALDTSNLLINNSDI